MKNLMSQFKLSTVMLVGAFGFLACAPVNFQKNPAQQCNGFGASACAQDPSNPTINNFNIDNTVPYPKVDILLVNDNSGSMQDIQQRMGAAFPTFISSLGSTLDWQIAMNTTDTKNENGNLRTFSNGAKVLSKSTANVNSVLLNSVQIPQTGYGDERGIYSANLAIQHNENGWMRPDAHLAVIILSDEDERSEGKTTGQWALETLDTPQGFIDTVRGSLGVQKTSSFHSIVTNNSACVTTRLQQQAAASLPLNQPFVGNTYMSLSNQTNGIIGSICYMDFGSQLASLGTRVNANTNSLKLACVPMQDSTHQVQVTFTPNPGMPINVTVTGDTVYFNPGVTPGTHINIKYSCQQ